MPPELFVIGLVVVFPCAAWMVHMSFRHRERMAELSRGDAAAEPGIVARLERIESAVETVALEVERIGESQRFLTRVMGDRALAPGDASHSA